MMNNALRPFTWTRAVAVALGCAVVAVTSTSHADNPIIQTNYTADPAPVVHEGVVYLYTSHDEDVTVDDFFTMNDWRLYTSTDIVNWTDRGSPLSYQDFSWSSGDAWAPHVIPRNGKWYFYVPITQNSGSPAIGVAVSDNPEGPFEDPLGRPLVADDWGDIDPSVFIDDDGQAYLYWGNPDLKYVLLNEDMVSYSGEVVHVPMTTQSFGARSGDPERATLYEEGPWFYRRGATYYLVYAAGGIPEYIAYSTSDSPVGPFTYGAVIMPTEGTSFTNHPAVIDFEGHSYFFYHNGALPGGGGFKRSVCVEEFEYNPDGSFPTLTMTTDGAPQRIPLNPYAQVEAETIAWTEGVETEACSEGGMNVTSIDNGDYIKVEGVDFGSGALSFEARAAAVSDGGGIELRLDGVSGALIGTCAIVGTGGWQMWNTVSCPVSDVQGEHDLYLVFVGGDGSLFNLNWWRFNSNAPPAEVEEDSDMTAGEAPNRDAGVSDHGSADVTTPETPTTGGGGATGVLEPSSGPDAMSASPEATGVSGSGGGPGAAPNSGGTSPFGAPSPPPQNEAVPSGNGESPVVHAGAPAPAMEGAGSGEANESGGCAVRGASATRAPFGVALVAGLLVGARRTRRRRA